MKEELLKQIAEQTDMYAYDEILHSNYSIEELQEVLDTLKKFNKAQNSRYEIEGFGIVDEQFLKHEYVRFIEEDLDEDDIIPNYDDWKFDLLHDERSAIREIDESEML